MKVSLSWLKEYIPVEMNTQELADSLTMAGLEVDSVTNRYDYLDGIVVSRIVDIAPHPNADKLTVCQVDVGDSVIQIVCGAPNASKDLVIPCALPGATLPNGMVIKKGKLRGEKSQGMLCSASELGLSNESSGIMPLETGAAPGTPLKEALELDDATIEIDLTPNRPDCLSLIGTAREISAFQNNGSKVTCPDPELPEPSSEYGPISQYTSVKIIDQDLCPRYAARLIFDIKVEPSPFWLQDRLNSVGLKPINNIVDITNFVMMETGQPLHAFDYDRLEENRIEVRAANEGETFTTLDENEHKLDPQMLMICDGVKPVALGGVMGGLNSEIEDSTTRVLLESAYFDPTCIRKTSKKTGLHTDAAHRFERGTDPEGVIYALNRAASLIASLGKGSLVDGIIDEYPAPVYQKPITMKVSAVNKRLGTDLNRDEMAEHLEKVDFSISPVDEDTLTITPPTFRVDVSRPEDLSEEIARLWGYNNIKTTFPEIPAETKPLAPSISGRNQIRTIFNGFGYTEAINYSFIHKLSCDRLKLDPDDERRNVVEIMNPLSEDQSVMRTSLVPGMLELIHHNTARQVKNLKVFEIGKVFFNNGTDTLPNEVEMLSGVLTGNMSDAAWFTKEVPCDFYDLKGALEGVFEGLHLKSVRFSPITENQCPYIKKGYAAKIEINDIQIGLLGKIHPEVASNYELKQDVYIFEINLEALIPMISPERSSSVIPRYPYVTRDTTIICDTSVQAGQLLECITNSGEALVENAELVDLYTGSPIPDGKRSLSFRITYRSQSGTLKDKAVNKVHTKLTTMLLNKFDAGLPG